MSKQENFFEKFKNEQISSLKSLQEYTVAGYIKIVFGFPEDNFKISVEIGDEEDE